MVARPRARGPPHVDSTGTGLAAIAVTVAVTVVAIPATVVAGHGFRVERADA
jgi:hypothetical protein